MRAISSHLTWPARRAVEAKDAVSAIEDHEGLVAVYEAIEQRKLDLVRQLSHRTPSDSGAEYADLIGQIKGLEEVPLIVAGIVENGRDAESRLRDEQES